MRPKSFNEDDVLQTIEETFRKVGYDGASLDVLTRATGLNRSSLYNAFGRKNDMMRRAVETYTARSCEKITATLSIRPMRSALRAFMCSTVQPKAEACLLGNLVAERAEADAEDRAFLASRMEEIENRLIRAMTMAQAEGEIAADADPVQLARYILTTVQGLRIMALAREDCDLFDGVINTALDAIPFVEAPRAA